MWPAHDCPSRVSTRATSTRNNWSACFFCTKCWLKKIDKMETNREKWRNMVERHTNPGELQVFWVVSNIVLCPCHVLKRCNALRHREIHVSLISQFLTLPQLPESGQLTNAWSQGMGQKKMTTTTTTSSTSGLSMTSLYFGPLGSLKRSCFWIPSCGQRLAVRGRLASWGRQTEPDPSIRLKIMTKK